MRKKNYYLILDVETANIAEDPFVYDVGFAVCDNKGNIYEKASYICTDIFDKEKELMQTAYYAKKIPLYYNGIKEGNFIKANLYTIRKHILDVIEKFSIKAVCAYNAGFDYNALNTTQRWTTKSKYRYFLPYGIPIFCIWHMACQVICTQKRYNKFCLENGFVSSKGNISTSAETVYAYITKEKNFEEVHMGLEDVLIEVQIMAHCFRQHKKMNKKINKQCWRIPQISLDKQEKI